MTHPNLESLSKKFEEIIDAKKLVPDCVARKASGYSYKLIAKLQSDKANIHDFKTFWPPRLIQGLRDDNAMIFFGAGVSAPCKLPTWHDLLSNYFGLEKSLTEDKDLQYDPLTLAEMASQRVGQETFQNTLRETMENPRRYSVNHTLMAMVECPIYITTNYDCLFENAWEDLFDSPPIVVTNDANLASLPDDVSGRCILYKIHGCINRTDETLILTRKDYRIHYRANRELFKKLRQLLCAQHTVFIGFSHRDPEVSRLVEDAIYDYENEESPSSNRPQIYSLQFNMSAHAPEVFAARGIVALKPPIVNYEQEHLRTYALSVALIDLIAGKHCKIHEQLALDKDLENATDRLNKCIENGMKVLRDYEEDAMSSLEMGDDPEQWLRKLLVDIGTLASQGVYLLDDRGNTIGIALPDGLNEKARRPNTSLNERPYFQQAKLFREKFLSDSVKSIFNDNSTFFVCMPVTKDSEWLGLLFCACQIGQWKLPIEISENLWKKGRLFLLIDSNGICLVPPNNEFAEKNAKVLDPERAKVLEAEPQELNIGFNFRQLHALSRRDSLVGHISSSVIPVSQDDDVLILSNDFSQFTVVSELENTRWKIGVSVPMFVAKEKNGS